MNKLEFMYVEDVAFNVWDEKERKLYKNISLNLPNRNKLILLRSTEKLDKDNKIIHEGDILEIKPARTKNKSTGVVTYSEEFAAYGIVNINSKNAIFDYLFTNLGFFKSNEIKIIGNYFVSETKEESNYKEYLDNIQKVIDNKNINKNLTEKDKEEISYPKISEIQLIFENCEVFSLTPDMYRGLEIEGIRNSLISNFGNYEDGSTIAFKSCDWFSIIINENALNKKMPYSIEQTLRYRLLNHKDITSICFVFENEEETLINVLWNPEDEYDNKFQRTNENIDGTITIKIG